MKSRQLSLANPKKILIVKLGSIGDVVHAIPVLRTLKSNLPGAHIAWVVEKKSSSILEGHPDIDELIIIDTKRWRKNINFATLYKIVEFITRIRNMRFDIAIDIQGLIKSGIIAWLSGAKKVIGFEPYLCREPLNRLFTNIKSRPENNKSHIVDICLSLLNPFGFKETKRDFFFSYHWKMKNM